MSAAVAFRTLAARNEGAAWALGVGWFDRAAVAGLTLAGTVLVWTTALATAEAVRDAVGVLLRVQMGAAALLATLAFARAFAREREKGVLDLLLLAPLPGFVLLLARVLGRLGGLLSTLAAGLPAILGCAAPGGVSIGELLVAQTLVVAVMAAAGGLSAAFSALYRGSAAAAGAALTLGAWLALPYLWTGFDALCPSGLLEAELADVVVDPSRAARGLAQGVAVLLGSCVVGGFALRRRHVRGAEPGWAARGGRATSSALRSLARSSRWGRYFQPLGSSGRLAALEGRDLVFRIAWLLGVGILSVVAVLSMDPSFSRRVHHENLAIVYGVFVVGLTSMFAALSLSNVRRSGRFEILLAANVEPDDLLRAELAGVLKLSAYLALPAAIYVLAWAALTGGSWSTALAIATGFAGFAAAALTAAVLGAAVATMFRRGAWVAAAAFFFVWPAANVAGVSIGSSLHGMFLVGPLWAGGLTVVYAWAVRRFRRWALT